MTTREKEVLAIVEKLGGVAHPTRISKEMGISSDYATQLCRDMTWYGYFVKKGLKYAVAPVGQLKKR